MSLKHIDLTTALRPSLLPDEVLLFVQDNVGLYEGYVSDAAAEDLKYVWLTASYSKYKIPQHQNGHAYLTSHRVCYVDNDDPRKHSVAIDLKDVDRYEFYVCDLLTFRKCFTDFKIGWFPQIISQNHIGTQAAEKIDYT